MAANTKELPKMAANISGIFIRQLAMKVVQLEVAE